MYTRRQLATFLLTVSLVIAARGAGAADYLAHADQLLAKGDIRAAEIELKNAVRSDPQDVAAHYRLARVELDIGNGAAAEFEARAAEVGGYDPDHAVPLLAEAYLAQHKYRELLRDFPGTAGSSDERARVLVFRGYALFAVGKQDDGLASLDQAQQLAPNLPEPLLAKAKVLIAKKDFDGAAADLDRALTFAPKDNEVRLTKAHLLRINGKPQDALALLQEVVTDAPTNLAARLERAEILTSQNQDAAAKQDIDAVLTIQPGNILAIYMQSVLLVKNKDYEGANTDLQKISGAIDQIPNGYYLIATVQLRLKHLDQAEDAARRFAARFPDNLAGHKLLALIQLNQLRPADALGTLQKFQTAGTADAGALLLLGQAYTQLGKTADAVAALDAAVKLAPQNPELQLRLGISRLRTGESTGMNDVEQSFELAPSAPAAELLMASDLAAGDWDKAGAKIAQLKQAQPDSPIPDVLYAQIKVAQFDLDGAHADLEKVTRSHPDYLPAQLALVRALELQGNLDQAEDALNKLLAAKPANGVVLDRLVPLLLRDSKADAALAAVERAHAAAPTDQAITAGLIDLYIQLGRKDNALTLAREENGTNSLANTPLIMARARAEVADGHGSDAIQTYHRLINIVPTRLDFRRSLAALQVTAGDLAGARQTINDAMTMSPHNPQLVADQLAIDLKDKGVEAALVTAKIQQSDPNLSTAPALEGDVYMAAEQYPNAREAYAKALQQKPSAMLVVRLARAKAAAGDRDGAASVLSDWLKDHPTDTGVAELLAGYDIEKHRYDDATKHLEQVAATPRPDAIALNNLAWLYQQKGDPRARILAERAYFMAPVPQIADTLGWLLVQQKAASNGLGLLEEASDKDKQNLEMRYHLAVAFNDTGHRDKAINLLKTLTEDEASFDDKPTAQKLLTELSAP